MINAMFNFVWSRDSLSFIQYELAAPFDTTSYTASRSMPLWRANAVASAVAQMWMPASSWFTAFILLPKPTPPAGHQHCDNQTHSQVRWPRRLTNEVKVLVVASGRCKSVQD